MKRIALSMVAVLSIVMFAGLKPADAYPQYTIVRMANDCGGYDYSVGLVDDDGTVLYNGDVTYSTCTG